MCYIVTERELVQGAKDYFSQIKNTDYLINRLTDTVSILRSSLTSIGNDLKPDKIQSSKVTDTMSATIDKIVDFENEINAYIDALVDLKREALERINKISDLNQRNVLIAKYVNGLKWEYIAHDLNFSMRQIHRIHGAALVDFAKQNPDIIKDGTL